MITDLLQRAAVELRGDIDLDELALAAAGTAHLLGAMRLVGERLSRLARSSVRNWR